MLSEIKHNIEWRFSIIQIFCLLLLFGMSVGYVDDLGKGVSIFGLLLNEGGKDFFRDAAIEGYEVWSNGISTYASIMYPLLVCLGFSFSTYYEKQGFRRSILIRDKRLKYCFRKITGAVVSGGIVFFIAYALLGILIGIKEPSFLPLFGAGGSVSARSMLRLAYSFIYGMEQTLFFVSVSVFFDDKYELMCLPVLIKYMLMIVSDRFLITGMKNDNATCLHVAQVVLNPENIVSNYSSLLEKLESILIAFVMYVLLILLYNLKIIMDGKYGKL